MYIELQVDPSNCSPQTLYTRYTSWQYSKITHILHWISGIWHKVFWECPPYMLPNFICMECLSFESVNWTQHWYPTGLKKKKMHSVSSNTGNQNHWIINHSTHQCRNYFLDTRIHGVWMRVTMPCNRSLKYVHVQLYQSWYEFNFSGLGIKDRLKSNQFVFFTLWMKSARAGYDLKMNTENLRKN